MKISVLFTPGFAISATKRDDATDVVSAISWKVSDLNAVANCWQDYSDVQASFANLFATVSQGTETIADGPDLSTTDALALTSPIQALTKPVERVISNLVNQNDWYTAAEYDSPTRQSLNDMYDAFSGLSTAVSTKVPDAVSDIAAQLVGGLTAAVQKGINAYTDIDDSSLTTTSTASSCTSSTASTTTAPSNTTTDPATHTNSPSGDTAGEIFQEDIKAGNSATGAEGEAMSAPLPVG